jgi:quinol-cytochrome oxidoreductase complex cytochrome b subunit
MPRTFRGHVARVSTGILRLLNVGIMLAAIATIIISVYLERPPSSIGWCFIGVGIVSFIAGLFGVRAASHRGCFSWHLIALLFSVGGLLSAALVIFIKVNQVVKNLKSKQNAKDTKNLVKLNGAIFFIMGCVQVVILVLAIIASCCEFVDYYEDLEMANRGTNMSGIAEESSKRAAKRRDTNASRLAETMKEKYGKWARDGDTSGGLKK